MLKYKFKETEKIKKLLIELEALKLVFDQLKILPQIEENLRRESLLKSALFFLNLLLSRDFVLLF